MKSKNEIETILQQTIDDIRDEVISPAAVNQAAERVWARVSAETAGERVETAAAERIESCADFQSLIPAHLNGSLSEARSLLLVDHTHECIPCRKAMNKARQRQHSTHVSTESVPPRGSGWVPTFNSRVNSVLQPVVLRWGIAAALVIGVGLLALPLIQRYAPFGGQLEATVQAAEGQVFQIADTSSRSLSAGNRLERGEHIRTAKDGHALIRLGDGSTIEMKERSEFFLTKNGQGTTIHLNRGAIVVEAAKQEKGRLFVDTGDSLVSVTGTVFSINSGTKGSRVSVIEGEVHLAHAGNERVLRAGDQASTNAAIEAVSIKDEVAWSRNATSYATALAGLSVLGNELNKVPRPGVRNSTHLLDMMPADTIVYAALPNLTTTIAESHRIMQERIKQNAALRDWWEKERGTSKGPNMDQVIDTIRQFGDYLGEEIAVSVSMDEKGAPGSPLVLAELKNSEGFRQFLEQQMAKYGANSTGRPQINFVENPLTASVPVLETGKKNDALYVWIQNDLFAASPNFSELQSVAGLAQSGTGSSFTSSPFHERIAQVYRGGAGLVVAANLERIVDRTKPERSKGAGAAEREEALRQLGVLSVKYFVLDQKEDEGKTHTRAALSFNDPQRGIPSWLAAPGPMGSLEYISPDANLVAGFVVKEPTRLVDDLLGVVETVSPDLRKNLEKLQNEHGLDLRRDFAQPLGGEFAFAIDGPILPTPSWKMVFEVNDPGHLQQTLERTVAEISKEAAKFGKAGLILDQTQIDGRAFYTLRSSDFGVEVNFTYVNGYMILGPSRAIVERAIKWQQAGNSLVHSNRFTAGLPADGNANFSAVFYHNLAPLVQPFADRIANSASNLANEQQQAIKNLAVNMPPTLAYAYAEGDSITFAANTEGGPFGLSPATLLGMPNALEMQHIIQQGLREK